MVKKKHNLAAFSFAILMAISMVVPGFAVESSASAASDSPSAIETVPNGTLGSSASPASALVPIKRAKNEIDGKMTIVEEFEVSSDIDPNSLIKDNFEADGYLYSKESIVRKSFSESKKDVEMEYRSSTDTKDLGQNIKNLPYSMQYEADGFIGDIHLDPSSVTTVPTDQTVRHSTKKEIKRYPMEMNDPSQVPQLYNGLKLSNIDWEVTGYLEGSSIPSGYTAVATYSRTSSWKEDCQWDVVATYRGTAVKVDNVCYTVTYEGELIPEGCMVVNGQIVEDPNAHHGFVWWVWLLPLLALVIIMAGAAFIAWALKRGLFASRKIIVQAQDDMTGEYTIIQKVHVSKKAPSFTLDTLKMPSAKHFTCEMSAREAQVLRGKIINVSADGNVVAKHQIQPTNDTDKYVFTVDLETVDKGPVDSFAL